MQPSVISMLAVKNVSELMCFSSWVSGLLAVCMWLHKTVALFSRYSYNTFCMDGKCGNEPDSTHFIVQCFAKSSFPCLELCIKGKSNAALAHWLT